MTRAKLAEPKSYFLISQEVAENASKVFFADATERTAASA